MMTPLIRRRIFWALLSFGIVVNLHDVHRLIQSEKSAAKADVNTIMPSQNQCLGFNENGTLERLISNANQIWITMAAKNAGSSLDLFTHKCMNTSLPPLPGQLHTRERVRDIFTEFIELPKIISQHSHGGSKFLSSLIKYTPRSALLIYVHRDEEERLLSAIKHVAVTRLCAEDEKRRDTMPTALTKDIFAKVTKNGTHCIVEEEFLLDVIQQKINEIGLGASEILACETYDAIEQNAPNMVIINYKQANNLQAVLAKQYCPHLLHTPVYGNVGAKRKLEVYVRLSKGMIREVSLQYWLSVKKDTLPFVLKLNRNKFALQTEQNMANCEAKTRHMEDALFTCPHESLHFSEP